jgi:hypothetical protein
MTSPAFRSALLGLLAANWQHSEIFDLSEWIEAGQVPAGVTDAWLGVQFIGGPVTLATIGPIEHHSWREQGTAILHLGFPVGEDTSRALLWSDELVNLCRGVRLGAHTIDFMEYFSDFAGAAIRLNGRWHGWSANLGYSSLVCT